MKLNNKRTVLVGLAFLSICAFWEMYDFTTPLVLRNTYHLGACKEAGAQKSDG